MNNVGGIVMPASCLGGIPALAAEYSRIPLVAVRENATILEVKNDKMQMENVIEVDSYQPAPAFASGAASGAARPISLPHGAVSAPWRGRPPGAARS